MTVPLIWFGIGCKLGFALPNNVQLHEQELKERYMVLEILFNRLRASHNPKQHPVVAAHNGLLEDAPLRASVHPRSFVLHLVSQILVVTGSHFHFPSFNFIAQCI